MTLQARFGHNLRRERKWAGLSQEELGFRASLHRTAVGQLERGERRARIDTLVKLAGALEIEPGALLVGMDWKAARSLDGHFEFPDEDASL